MGRNLKHAILVTVCFVNLVRVVGISYVRLLELELWGREFLLACWKGMERRPKMERRARRKKEKERRQRNRREMVGGMRMVRQWGLVCVRGRRGGVESVYVC